MYRMHKYIMYNVYTFRIAFPNYEKKENIRFTDFL